MRVVLDTNVLLAGIATHGLCEVVLDACLGADPPVVVLSEHTLGEVAKHLGTKFKMPPEEVREAVNMLRSQTELVEPVAVSADACRDADDLLVQGTLIAAGADCLVTGDKDLLALGQFGGKPILSPRQFYEQMLGE